MAVESISKVDAWLCILMNASFSYLFCFLFFSHQKHNESETSLIQVCFAMEKNGPPLKQLGVFQEHILMSKIVIFVYL